MRSFFNFTLTIAVIFAGVYAYLKVAGGKVPSIGADLLSSYNSYDADDGYTDLVDKSGRNISCIITARKGDFVEIEREQDKKKFLLSINSLSPSSKAKLSRVSDFNESQLIDRLYEKAKKAIKPELLYIFETYDYKGEYHTQRLNTREVEGLEKFRMFLREMGVKHKESSMDIKRIDASRFFYPPGIKDAPCIRIEEAIMYSTDEKEFKKLMIDAYCGGN